MFNILMIYSFYFASLYHFLTTNIFDIFAIFSLDITYELNVMHFGIRNEISHYLPLSFADLFYVRLKSKSFYVLIAAHVLDTGLDQT